MPLPTDDATVKTGQEIVDTLKGMFHTPAGFRPAHAKGIVFKGNFTPTSEAASLTTAPHFNNSSTPIYVRFSNSTGLPQIPDTDANGDPRGLAVRFMLGEHQHTDIIAHSTPFFPARTGEQFLGLFQAIIGGTIQNYLAENPSAMAFVSAPKSTPSSFARETYWGINAFKFINKEGKATFIRYSIVPETGNDFLDAEALKTKSNDFLFEDIEKLVKSSSPVIFKLMAQIAEDGDITNDATVHWPEERKMVTLGTINVESEVEDSLSEQKRMTFDPIPRVEGVEPSDDPLLEMRAGVYLLSGRERRAA